MPMRSVTRGPDLRSTQASTFECINDADTGEGAGGDDALLGKRLPIAGCAS